MAGAVRRFFMIKKTLLAISAVLCAATIGFATLAACSDSGNEPKDDPTTQTPADPADPSTPTDPAGPDNPGTTPETPEPTYTEVLTDNGAVFSSANMKTVIEDARYPYDSGFTDEHTYIFTIDTGWSNNDTSIRERATVLTSSDEDVIPESALSYKTVTNMDIVGSKGNNHIQQIEIMLDTSKVSKGSAYVTMGFTSGNTSRSFELCAELTVFEQGEYEVETMSETLEVDVRWSDASDFTDFTVRFFDEDYIEGSTVNGEACTYWFEEHAEAENGKVSITFDYIVGHRYTITFTAGAEYNVYSALILSNSASGGNGYYKKDDDPTAYLVYTSPNKTVSIDAGDWFYPNKH